MGTGALKPRSVYFGATACTCTVSIRMSKRPLSERNGDEEEEDLGLRGRDATKKTRVDGGSNEAAGILN